MEKKTDYEFDSLDKLERSKALISFYESTTFPTLLARVKALIVDLLIILLIFSITSVIIGELANTPDWVRGAIFIFSVYLYEPFFISFFGGTIGHKFVGIGVKNIKNPNKKINIIRASMRFITKYLLGWLSFLTITANPKKRAIHDLASKSIVLYKSS